MSDQYNSATMLPFEHDILPSDRERALIAQAQAGDNAAMDQVLRANQKLVLKLANQFPELEWEDRISLGNEGLMRAALKFDHSQGVRFSTYAFMWVRERLIRAREASYVVHIPRKQLYNRGDEDASQSASVSGRPQHVKASTMDHLMIEGPDSAEELFESHDRLLGSVSQAESELDLNRLLELLTPNEAEVVKAFHGIGVAQASLAEQARWSHRSGYSIRADYNRAMAKLKHHCCSN